MGEEDFISFSIFLIFFACKHYIELKRSKPGQKKILCIVFQKQGHLIHLELWIAPEKKLQKLPGGRE
jgi:hypothetical protein